jgi:hypothetical protein
MLKQVSLIADPSDHPLHRVPNKVIQQGRRESGD